ncbi:DALR anticodon-binding domain-containing protein [Klebsiella sp. K47]
MALSQARLLLSINVQQVLRNGLELLGVSAPETM